MMRRTRPQFRTADVLMRPASTGGFFVSASTATMVLILVATLLRPVSRLILKRANPEE